MSLLPFVVNQGGQRVVRWHHLVLVWLLSISATLLGSCTMGYILTDNWRYGAFIGIVVGVGFSSVVTVFGFKTPVDNLPPLRPKA